MAGPVRLRRCSGESRCRKVVCRGGKRSVSHPIREKGGELFTDYYFGKANTANKSDKLHNNAKSKNLNWGGFLGCYSSLPPTEDLVPRSRTIRGGGGRGGGERRRETQHHQQRTRLHVDDELLSRQISAERRDRRKYETVGVKRKKDNDNRIKG